MKKKEANKKEASMVIVDASTAKIDFANIVLDVEWPFNVKSSYSFSTHDACMIVADMHVWYFDSGASEHITSHCDLFSSLETVPSRKTIMCANNSSYPIKGIGKI